MPYFISGHALRPIREFSDKIEEVQAQNLAASRIEENKVKELNLSSNGSATRRPNGSSGKKACSREAS